MKKGKKIIAIVSVFAIIAMGVLQVYAGVCVAKTSLHISTGSSLKGSKYSMPYDSQALEFHWTTIGQTHYGKDPYMTIETFKKGVLFYGSNRTDTLSVPVGTSVSTMTYNNIGSGSYYWYFTTGNANNPSGYFDADPVWINSY